MAFPEGAISLDTFARPSNGLGDNWGTVAGYESLHIINDNSAGLADSGTAFNYWAARQFPAHQEVYAVVAAAGSDLWLGFRLQTPDSTPDGYRVECRHIGSAVSAYLVRVSNSAALGSPISMGITALAAGDAVGVDANGTTITLYYRASGGAWASMGTWTDSSVSAAGYIGLGVGGFPRRMYVPTRLSGIYYTDDFTAPDDSTQPTWSNVSGGLTNLVVRAMDADPFNAAGRQVCLTCSADQTQTCPDGVAHIRFGTGDWSAILTQAQARTLTSDTDAALEWVTMDKSVSGRIWVAGRSRTGVNGPFYFFYSDDDGSTWNYKSNTVTLCYYGGNLIATGDVLWHGRVTESGSGSRVGVSLNGGDTWTDGNRFTSGGYIPYIAVNPLESTRAYSQGHGDTPPGFGLTDLIYLTTTNLNQTVLQDLLDLGVANPQWIWFSQASAGYQRLVKGNIIYTTLNGWTTVETVPAAKSENVDVILAPAGFNENWLILGARSLLAGQNHIIYTSVGDTGALSGKAGSDPVGGTNSIPRAAGGVSLSGIEVIG